MRAHLSIWIDMVVTTIWVLYYPSRTTVHIIVWNPNISIYIWPSCTRPIRIVYFSFFITFV